MPILCTNETQTLVLKKNYTVVSAVFLCITKYRIVFVQEVLVFGLCYDRPGIRCNVTIESVNKTSKVPYAILCKIRME